MSDNWNPPPGRNPDEPEPEGDQPAGPPAKGPAREGGQSPLWWTESTEKQKEYLQPAPPGDQPPLVGPPGQRPNHLTWNLPPYSQPGSTPPGPPLPGPRPAALRRAVLRLPVLRPVALRPVALRLAGRRLVRAGGGVLGMRGRRRAGVDRSSPVRRRLVLVTAAAGRPRPLRPRVASTVWDSQYSNLRPGSTRRSRSHSRPAPAAGASPDVHQEGC